MEILIVGGKISENPGFEAPLRKVFFFVFYSFHFHIRNEIKHVKKIVFIDIWFLKQDCQKWL